MAETFDEAWNSDKAEKAQYKNILTKIIDFSFILSPTAIPISRIWKSIKVSIYSILLYLIFLNRMEMMI